MNNDVLQMQLELNIENLVVNMVLKKRVKTRKSFFHASL